jgi:hypothetical protein
MPIKIISIITFLLLSGCGEPSKLNSGYVSVSYESRENMERIKSYLSEKEFSYYTYTDDRGEWIAYPSAMEKEFDLLTSAVLEIPPDGYTGSCNNDEYRQKVRSENMEANGVENVFRYESRRELFCIYYPKEKKALVESIDPLSKAINEARKRAVNDGEI